MKRVTLLIPCYNEEQSLPLLYERLLALTERHAEYAWELLMVNDGSRDGTLAQIKQLRARDERVCYLDLSRNFGKERAMLAGLDHATGDCVVIMDADLQDPPELVSQMLRLWEEGYDDVYARQNSRERQAWLRRWFSQTYYRLLQRMTRVDMLPNVGDFRLLDRRCVDALRQMRETERYTKGLFVWIGYNKKEVTYDKGDRVMGKSSFNFWSLLNLGLNGITSFTTAPLRISTVLGLLVSVFTFLYMCYFLLKTLILGDPVQGFPTLIVVILFLGGVQLLSLGIIGEYLGRIYSESKHRPVYFIREKGGLQGREGDQTTA